jgi:predicted enzyme related to lactoylglutathione lyase
MQNFLRFFEIPAVDFDRAVKFYTEVFDTELSIAEDENEKMACFMDGGKAIGAISLADGFKPSRDGVMVSLYAGEEMDEILKKVLSNDGEIVTSKTKIEVEGLGYFAVMIDSEGNKIGLYSDK